jgi:hypothetical protein
VLIARRAAGLKEFGAAIAQPLRIPGERDRIGRGVRGGLLERQRQVAQCLRDSVDRVAVLLAGALAQELHGLGALPHVKCQGLGV